MTMCNTVDQQLEALAVHCPKTVMGLVSFDLECKLIGDGITQEGDMHSLADQKGLFDEAWLAREAKEKLLPIVKKPISEAKKALQNEILKLQVGKSTALGPAAYLAYCVAKEHKPGSQIVVCTDGLALCGVGMFHKSIIGKTEAFYEKLGE